MKTTLTQITIGLLASIASGILMMLAFPPFGYWPLVFIAWVPVSIAQYRIVPKKLVGVASAIALYIWLQAYLGPVFGEGGSFMIYLPAFIALVSLLLDAGLRRDANKTNNKYVILQSVGSWGTVELIRLFIPIAGTWGFVAYPLYLQTWLIQPVSLFGIIGLGMLIIAINFGITLNLMHLWDKRKWIGYNEENSPVSQRLLFRSNAVIGSLIILWLITSLIQYTTISESASTVTAAAIQPQVTPINVAYGKDKSQLEESHKAMIAETRKVAASGAKFVVWPEGALSWDPQVSDPYKLTALAQEENIFLVIGYVVKLDDGLRNEATIISPEGKFLGVFGKDHPVLFSGETSLTQGTYPVYDTEIGKMGTVICYDADYTDTSRKLAKQGAQIIAVPSNDWEGIAPLHYTHVVFRAIENRVAMVKSDGNFTSAVIAPNGKIMDLKLLPKGGGATALATVPIGDGKATISALLGDWMGWLSVVIFVVTTALTIRTKK